ncbi:MAG TPA: AmmeMemoRadiSam system protein B [Thermodesulfovibrionales bacterium]|nr:AmmeMemoRadiSam system protein B [Thermodesulfovibrionales bacterium]
MRTNYETIERKCHRHYCASRCSRLLRGCCRCCLFIHKISTILASSDMSHYLPDKTARLKDKKAIDKILDIDPKGLYDSVIHEKISMCGCLPTVTMLSASTLLGAKTTHLVKYMTSGEVSGD